MNILFLTQFYWPEVRTAPINLAAMANDLQTKGHKVMVITGFPNHPLGRIYEGYKIQPWQWDDVRGVKVLRLPLYPDHSRSLARRMLNYGSFALSAATLGSFLSYNFKPDIMFTYFAPLTVGAPAAILSLLHRIPMVYWITDLWPENLHAGGARIGPGMYRTIRKVEDWGYRQAKTICVDSPGFKHNLIEKGVPSHKIHVVVEWADEDLFFPTKYDENLAQQFGLAGKFNIIYGGTLGPVQGLGTVIDAARLLQDLENMQFVFIGDGNDEENLKRQVSEYALQNVRFIPRQPPEDIHRFFALADVLLVHLKRKPIFELQLPSKIIAYLACGRPILCAMSGSAAKIVHDAGAGVFCRSEDPQAMAEQVRTLYAMSKSEREAMGQRGRQTHLHNYTRTVQVNRIEEILKRVAGVSQNA